MNTNNSNHKQMKAQAMLGIIASAMLDGDNEDRYLPSDEGFNELPFAYQVVAKKLEAFEVKTKFTHLATMLIALYSENNPGMVQLLAAQCIESNRDKVDVNLIVNRFPEEVPSPSDRSFSKLWDSQKIAIPVDSKGNTKLINAVDTPAFWIHLSEGKNIEESIQAIKSKLDETVSDIM
ncbi:hypothetical protein SP15_123 [Bacillus phage SP-15]|uniref:Uncharacterized protein n=1 Tax=Bacillus phage SP-15 TaxID=1792032 RepID=A0A127AYU7_9CAUD|nr:hypothetical protein SP15_123 [Bacillus phage SP-15]AMM44921.1 hypothetical protein SP15_123 [Bacillus phage SP-15]